MTNEELITEAQRRFPIGTVFHPAHSSERHKTTIKNGVFLSSGGSNPYLFEIDKHGDRACVEGTSLWNVVYYNKKWATIISIPAINESDYNVTF